MFDINIKRGVVSLAVLSFFMTASSVPTRFKDLLPGDSVKTSLEISVKENYNIESSCDKKIPGNYKKSLKATLDIDLSKIPSGYTGNCSYTNVADTVWKDSQSKILVSDRNVDFTSMVFGCAMRKDVGLNIGKDGVVNVNGADVLWNTEGCLKFKPQDRLLENNQKLVKNTIGEEFIKSAVSMFLSPVSDTSINVGETVKKTIDNVCGISMKADMEYTLLSSNKNKIEVKGKGVCKPSDTDIPVVFSAMHKANLSGLLSADITAFYNIDPATKVVRTATYKVTFKSSAKVMSDNNNVTKCGAYVVWTTEWVIKNAK